MQTGLRPVSSVDDDRIGPDFVSLQHGRPIRRPGTQYRGGKSGQQRAPSFLTGRCPKGYSSVTENNSPATAGNW